MKMFVRWIMCMCLWVIAAQSLVVRHCLFDVPRSFSVTARFTDLYGVYIFHVYWRTHCYNLIFEKTLPHQVAGWRLYLS